MPPPSKLAISAWAVNWRCTSPASPMSFCAVGKPNGYIRLAVWAVMAMRWPIGTPLERGWRQACVLHAEKLSSHSLIVGERMPCNPDLKLRLDLAIRWGGWEGIVGEARWMDRCPRKFAYRLPPGGTPSKVAHLLGGKNCPVGCSTT
jgi:hypothetical protein